MIVVISTGAIWCLFLLTIPPPYPKEWLCSSFSPMESWLYGRISPFLKPDYSHGLVYGRPFLTVICNIIDDIEYS